MEKILDRVTALVTILTVVIVTASVSHEMGYFAYFGRFFQAFVTASDYFVNAILWLPFAVLTALAWINLKDFFLNVPSPVLRKWRTWIVPLLFFCGTLFVFLFLQDGFPAMYFILIAYIWIVVFDKLGPTIEAENQFGIVLKNLVKFGVVFSMGFFTLGYMSAQEDSKKLDAYEITMKESGEIKRWVPLRNFDKGVLFRNPISNTVSFVKWDDIASINKYLGNPAEPMGCIWFGWNCRKERITP
jgi:hypothetical protein